MVPAERKPGCCDTDEATEKQVETKVSEVCETSACDVDCASDWGQDQNEGVDWWRGRLIADRDYVIVLIVAARGREGRLFMLMNGENGATCRSALLEVRRRDSGGVCWVRGELARRKVRDGDGELGRKEQSQVEQTGPGDYDGISKRTRQ